MEEEKKPFDTVSIVILVLLSIANDAAEIFFDILAATVVGLPGEAIMEPIDFIMDGIVTFWFFGVCGFGGPSIIQLVDDLLELVGIPGRTICVAAGILIANNPRLAAVAEIAGGAAAAGGMGATAEAGEAMGTGAAVAETGEEARTAAIAAGEETTAATATSAESGAEQTSVPSSGEEAGGKEEEEERGKKSEEEEVEKEMEPEEERPPEEVEKEKLFEQTPQAQEKDEEEDADTEERARPSNVFPIEDIRKAQRIKEVEENLKHPKAPHDITEDDKDEDNENFRAAA